MGYKEKLYLDPVFSTSSSQGQSNTLLQFDVISATIYLIKARDLAQATDSFTNAVTFDLGLE